MERLKRLGIFMVLLGVICIGMAVVDLIDNSKETLAFEDLKVSQLKSGEIVEGEVLVTLGCFQEGYRTRYGIKSSSSEYYYVVYVEDKVIALKCVGNTHKALEKQTNAYLNYMNNSGDEEFDLDGVPIKGKIKSMDSETRKNMEEYLYDEESGTRFAEIEPYIIDNGILSMGQSMLMIAIGVVLIAIPLLIIIISWRKGSRYSRYE